MNEGKKILITVVFGFALLFLLSTNVFIPLLKDNGKQRTEFNQLKNEVETVQAYSGAQLAGLTDELDVALAEIDKGFLPEDKVQLTEQLTTVGQGTSIEFVNIAYRAPMEKDTFSFVPVEVELRASFRDLIAYLVDIEQDDMFVGIEKIQMKNVTSGESMLATQISFVGVRASDKGKPASAYFEQRYAPFDERTIRTLIKAPSLPIEENVLAQLQSFDPFVSVHDIGVPVQPTMVIPTPHEINIVDNFSLKGIVRMGDKKAALINETMVWEGDTIAGVKVETIYDYYVVLNHLGKEIILTIGVDDAFIKL